MKDIEFRAYIPKTERDMRRLVTKQQDHAIELRKKFESTKIGMTNLIVQREQAMEEFIKEFRLVISSSICLN